MCEIQFIYKDGTLKKNDLDEFIKMMSFGSLKKHNDAWGFFTDKMCLRMGGEFDPDAKRDIYPLKSNFIIGHNRLATMGVGQSWGGYKDKTKEEVEDLQHHPFELGDFMMVHNGVIHNAKSLFKKHKIQTPVKTDSFVIIYLIEHYFKISLKRSRQEKIIDAIQKATPKLTGWYSIVLYDKKGKKLYYFKDAVTKFHLCMINESFLVGSTSKWNINHTYLAEDKKCFTPKRNIIYHIGKGNRGKFFREIGRLDPTKEESDLKKLFASEGPGEISHLISNLPGNPTDYEISENFKIKIFCKSLTKAKSKLLKDHLTSKGINFTIEDTTLILELGEII